MGQNSGLFLDHKAEIEFSEGKVISQCDKPEGFLHCLRERVHVPITFNEVEQAMLYRIDRNESRKTSGTDRVTVNTF